MKNFRKTKQLHNLFFAAIFCLLVLIGIFSFALLKNANKLEQLENNRFKLFTLGIELKESSEDLTKYCRTYVLTGDSIWEQKYWELLDIRNGVAPRPDGRIIALQDSLLNLGIARDEFEKLGVAEKNSNDLVWTENIAFHAMKGLFADTSRKFTIEASPDPLLARRIMFDQKYHDDKKRIMQPIAEFRLMLDKRISLSIEKQKFNNNILLITIILLILASSILSFYAILILRKRILTQIGELENSHIIIKKNEKKLIQHNKELDNIVEDRTKELTISNEELAAISNALKENEAFLMNIFENIPNMIFVKNAKDLRFTNFNKAGEKLLGYKREELIGKNDYDIFPKEQADFFTAKDRDVFKQNNLQIIEEERIDTKYGERILFTKKIAIKDKEGKNKYLLGVSEDITEKIKIKQELIAAKQKAEESDRLKTEFINNMSHEIRTPMNGILGFSDLLSEDNLSTEKRNNFISIIQNSGNQLMRIIDDILEISKLETKQVKINEKEICLNDLLLEHFSIFDIKAKENKTPLYLKNGLSDIESTIYIDETKLKKILSNLLTNSLKFTNEGFIEFGYQLRNNELEIYVKDTGIGIQHSKQELIFERFSQEEKDISKNVGGLGLGLSIAKENAELLGGKITLKSKKDHGATFYVTIPYKPASKEAEDKYPDNMNSKIITEQEQVKILIVEDEEVTYLYFEALFEYEVEFNHSIIHARNGLEAVEICKENSEIGFVFMDLKMPIMNGFEATKQIKQFRPNLPIIAQTAYSSIEDKKKALAAGCDDFISKPLSKEIFIEIINKYLIE